MVKEWMNFKYHLDYKDYDAIKKFQENIEKLKIDEFKAKIINEESYQYKKRQINYQQLLTKHSNFDIY